MNDDNDLIKRMFCCPPYPKIFSIETGQKTRNQFIWLFNNIRDDIYIHSEKKCPIVTIFDLKIKVGYQSAVRLV